VQQVLAAGQEIIRMDEVDSRLYAWVGVLGRETEEKAVAAVDVA